MQSENEQECPANFTKDHCIPNKSQITILKFQTSSKLQCFKSQSGAGVGMENSKFEIRNIIGTSIPILSLFGF